MTISASIPVEYMDAANAELDAGGFGATNFSVPVRSGTVAATHAAFHSWDDAAFLAAVQALDYPGLVVRYEPGPIVNFKAHCADRALEWSDPAKWFENPVMKDAERTKDGKTWVSLIDYNVWEPPVGWREVVSEGYPAWVQPTGAHDAYALGDRVSFEGANYESVINANVWSPATYPAGWKAI